MFVVCIALIMWVSVAVDIEIIGDRPNAVELNAHLIRLAEHTNTHVARYTCINTQITNKWVGLCVRTICALRCGITCSIVELSLLLRRARARTLTPLWIMSGVLSSILCFVLTHPYYSGTALHVQCVRSYLSRDQIVARGCLRLDIDRGRVRSLN